MAEIELTLNSPLTEEQFDTITDVDFDHTNRIWFHTKHGKTVEFVKAEPPTTAAAPPATNADRIRGMSDEELAKKFCELETSGMIYGPSGRAAWLDWLRSSAGGEFE